MSGRSRPSSSPSCAWTPTRSSGWRTLARGPTGSRWAAPAALFAEAYRLGRASQLDSVCRAAAARTFLAAVMPESMTLFVNVEPVSFGSECPPDLAGAIGAARGRRTVLEVTERIVGRDPAGMLAAVESARQDSLGIALDDVGADPASLAMMPLIRPDVIKLDLSIIQGRTTLAVATVVNAVMAEAERRERPRILRREGIESERHVRWRRPWAPRSARVGSSGRPTARTVAGAAPLDRATAADPPAAPTPPEAVAGRRLSQATEQLLRPLSMHLEYKGLDATESTVLLACFQDRRRFGARTRRRYAELAARGVFTAVFSRDMPARPVPGIRGARLDPADPLGREWAVIVLGAHFAAALLARERDDSTDSRERVFDFVVTHDRELVIAAARPVLKRVLAAGWSAPTGPVAALP